MLREPWDFVQELTENALSADSNETRQKYVEQISEYLLAKHPGTKSASDRKSAKCCARIFSEIVLDGRNVITPHDVDVAVEHESIGNLSKDKTIHNVDVESWFGQANLKRVKEDYLSGTQWDQYKYIYVAPILPNIDDFMGALGEPTLIKSKTIENTLQSEFSGARFDNDLNNSDRILEVDPEEVSAFVGLIKSEMDSNDWTTLSDISSNDEIWVNIPQMSKIIEENGTDQPEDSVDEVVGNTVRRAASKTKAEFSQEFDTCANEIKRVLLSESDWWAIRNKDAVWWYSSYQKYVEDLVGYTKCHQKTVNSVKDATEKELKAAVHFFENNGNDVADIVESDLEKVSKAVRRLKGELEPRTMMEKLESATIPSSSDDIDSTIESETKSRHEIVFEIEKSIEGKNGEKVSNDSSIGR